MVPQHQEPVTHTTEVDTTQATQDQEADLGIQDHREQVTHHLLPHLTQELHHPLHNPTINIRRAVQDLVTDPSLKEVGQVLLLDLLAPLTNLLVPDPS